MEQKRLDNKILLLRKSNDSDDKGLCITFLDAISSLLCYMGKEVYEYSTRNSIESSLDDIYMLIDMVDKSNEEIIPLMDTNVLYEWILYGLSYKIQKQLN